MGLVTGMKISKIINHPCLLP